MVSPIVLDGPAPTLPLLVSNLRGTHFLLVELFIKGPTQVISGCHTKLSVHLAKVLKDNPHFKRCPCYPGGIACPSRFGPLLAGLVIGEPLGQTSLRFRLPVGVPLFIPC